MTIDIGLLGPVEVTVEGQPSAIKGRRRLTLLAALALNAGNQVSRDRLIEAVWGEDVPSNPDHSLEGLISRLRQNLGSTRESAVIVTVGNGYMLTREAVRIDTVRFQDLVVQARRVRATDPGRAARVLREALGLWRGPVLDGLDVPPSLLPQVTELDEFRLSAVEDRIDADIADGGHARVVGELQTLVRDHPFRERIWGLLMVALYRSGRQTEALRAYQGAREHLGESLGIEPGPELQDLEEKILLHDESMRPLVRRPTIHNIPLPPNSLVGRVDELKMIEKLLEAARLVTLVGPGGVGKTRLALETGRRLVDDGNEVWLIDLTQLTAGDDIMGAVAAAIGLLGAPIDGRPLDVEAVDLVAPYVAGRSLTIILDNSEHVIDDAAQAAFQLLRMGPEVRLLATSREALRVPDERVYETLPFSVDAEPRAATALSHAVQLFVDRASAASSTFELTEENHRHVVSICRRLDGVALSIELAAAQVGVFDLEEIATRLESSLESLEDGYRTSDPRHQSVRAAIEWSYELLSEEGQHLLPMLAAFRGPFDLAALEALVPDLNVRAVLSELVRKCVVQSQPITVGSRRYRLLEVVREFASGRLDSRVQRDALDARHAAVFAGRAEEGWKAAESPRARAAAEALLLDLADLRAALHWFAEHDANGFLSVAGSLGWFFDWQGLTTEGAGWLDRALNATESIDTSERARALHASLLLSMWTADAARRRRAGQRGQEAFEMYQRLGDGAGEARALLTLARVGWQIGSGTVPYKYRDATELYRRHGTRWGLAWALFREGQDLLMSNAALEAGTPYKLVSEAADIFAEVGDHQALAETVVKKAYAAYYQTDSFVPPHLPPAQQALEEAMIEEALGVMEAGEGNLAASAALYRADRARQEGDFPTAERYLRRCMAALEERLLFDKVEMADLEQRLGWVLLGRGDLASSLRAFERSANHAIARGNEGSLVSTVESLVTMAVDLGLFELAAKLHGSASGFRRQMAEGPYRESGYDMPRWDVPRYRTSLDTATAALGRMKSDSAVAEGATWSLIEAKERAVAALLEATE